MTEVFAVGKRHRLVHQEVHHEFVVAECGDGNRCEISSLVLLRSAVWSKQEKCHDAVLRESDHNPLGIGT